MRSEVGRRPGRIPVAVLLLAAACGGGREGAGEPTTHAGAPASAAAPAPKQGGDPVALCEHGVPRDVCTRCNPDLVPVFKELGDWCEHELPKSQCRQCNPQLDFSAKAIPEDWCNEHGVPESMCTKCKPSLVAHFIEIGDYCREHGYPKSVCPICNPALVTARGKQPPMIPSPGTKVRLASDETAREAGITTTPAERRRFAETIEVVGRLDFDQNKLAQVSAAVAATVVEVKVDVGDTVRAGDPLLVLASADIGEDQAKLSTAQARVETAAAALAREQSLFENGISARKQVERARSELAAARAQLDAARSSLRVAGVSSEAREGKYVLAAPFDGTVVARDAVAGRTVAQGQVLAEIADLATMWALLELPEAAAEKVRPGQVVSLSFEGLSGRGLEASISRVGASVDPATRTVRGRVDVPNGDHSLKAGLFVRARIHLSDDRDATLVPREAVQYAEGQPVVFVRDTDAVYLPMPVKLGGESDGRVEILEGLAPGARVVTSGAFLLKTEILKDSIGAGCCAEDGK